MLPLPFSLIAQNVLVNFHGQGEPFRSPSEMLASEKIHLTTGIVYPKPTEQIVGGLHVQAGKDRCHDADHALTALVHRNRIAVSPFVRLQLWIGCYNR